MKRYDPRPRAYDMLVPLLQQGGIHYVDGHVIDEKLKSESVFPVFTKGGSHWMDASALPHGRECNPGLHARAGKLGQDIDKSVLTMYTDHEPRWNGAGWAALNIVQQWDYPAVG